MVSVQRLYEVTAEEYFFRYLKEDDAQSLRTFVNDFGSRLSIPSAILAVGSSTFPDEHWTERRNINVGNPKLNAPESYQDIDLVIVPEVITPLERLDLAVQKALKIRGHQFEKKDITSMGVSYVPTVRSGIDEPSREVISGWAHFDYDLHSISTHLRNGTKLDLIIGRDDLMMQTAEQKIAQERSQNFAFSLLYGG